MAEDYVFHEALDGDQARRKAYAAVVQMLREMGKTQKDFPTLPNFDTVSVDDVDCEYEQREGERLYALANRGQRKVIDTVLQMADALGHDRKNPSNAVAKCAYIGGEGGTCFKTVYGFSQKYFWFNQKCFWYH